jgi:hypothetical protein
LPGWGAEIVPAVTRVGGEPAPPRPRPSSQVPGEAEAA